MAAPTRNTKFAESRSPERAGRVVTFYSYKGGTGRSMALANVAWVLASAGRRVLVVDWDLEAPGLHRYFAPFLVDRELAETSGIIDLMWDFVTEAMTPDGGEDLAWYEPLADLRRIAVSLDYPFPAPGTLDFVPAGRQDAGYSQRVGTMDWSRFYNEMGGGVFLEAVRARVRAQYDYVLIDSRTGVSDTAGVCTVQMPDALVACFTANYQSIAGVAAVAASVRTQWAGDPDRSGAAGRIYPLLTRVDPFEKDKLERRRDLARAEFADFLARSSGGAQPGRPVLNEVPYIPFYAYEETLAVFGDTPGDQEAALLPAIERLTALISEGDITRLESPPEDWRRREVLARFEGRTAAAAAEVARKVVARKRFDVFLSYSSADGPVVHELAHKLKAEGIEPWLDQWNLIPGTAWQPEIEEVLAACNACAVFIGPSGLSPWQHEEMLLAISRRVSDRERNFRVIPVLLPGTERPERSKLPGFLSATTWVEFRRTLDDDQAFRYLMAGIRGTEPGPHSFEDRTPYRGLEAFDTSDSPLFFGREALTEWLLHSLRPPAVAGRENRFLAVAGPSGSGKSSLVRAGLIPAIHSGALEGSEGWPVVMFRPGPEPFFNLARALSPLAHESASVIIDRLPAHKDDRRSLHAAAGLILGEPPRAGRLVVVVDQFEEVFTLCNDEAERREFIANLLHAATATGGRTTVVLTIRADFFGPCASYPDLAAALSDHLVLVGPLTRDELRRAIERPAFLAGCEVEPGLTELLIDNIEGQPGALPLLQFALLELWRRRDGRRLTLAAYREIGEIEGALQRRADEVLYACSPLEQEICRRIFLRLIQPGEGTEDIKRRTSFRELLPNSNPAPVLAVIQKLANARLVTTEEDASGAGEGSVEIAHESLIRSWPTLRNWIEADRAGLRIHRRLTEAAQEWVVSDSDVKDDYLYTGSRLAIAADWAKDRRDELSSVEASFLAASRDFERRHRAEELAAERHLAEAAHRRAEGIEGLHRLLTNRRRLMVVAAAVALAAVVLTGSLVGLYKSLSAANAARVQAVADRDASRRVAWKAEVDRTEAEDRYLRAEALRLAAEAEVVLERNPQRAVLLAAEALGVSGAIVGPHATEAGDVLRRALGDSALDVFAEGNQPASFAISLDGRRLTTVGAGGAARAWDLAAKPPRPILLRGADGPASLAALSANGRRQVLSGPGGILVWDLDATGAGAVPIREAPEGPVAKLALSRDGRRLAVLAQGLEVWDVDRPDAAPVRLRERGDLSDCLFAGPGFRGLVAYRRGGAATLWASIDSKAQPIALGGGNETVTCAAVSSDGRWLGTGGPDGMTRVRDLAAAVPPGSVVALGGNRGAVAAIAFSPDGRWLASGGEDGAVRVWDLAIQPIGPSPVVLAGHERGVASLGFSPDSRRLATGDSASARLWDLTSSPPAIAAVIPAGRGVPVSQVAFDADRRQLIAASDAVRAWVLPLAELLELARRAAGRNFTAEEWGRYFPGQAYRRTFPDLPGP